MPKKPYQYTTENYPIPDILKVPEDHVLLLQAYARGVQKYACPVSATSKAKPHAILLSGDRGEGDLVATHFGGPTWQALDGSSVVGKVLQTFPAPDPDAVAWLLLEATSTTGKGLFEKVAYIQRVDTNGGKPPPEGRDPAINQTEVLKEYFARYNFWVPAAKHRY